MGTLNISLCSAHQLLNKLFYLKKLSLREHRSHSLSDFLFSPQAQKTTGTLFVAPDLSERIAHPTSDVLPTPLAALGEEAFYLLLLWGKEILHNVLPLWWMLLLQGERRGNISKAIFAQQSPHGWTTAANSLSSPLLLLLLKNSLKTFCWRKTTFPNR